MQKYTWKMASNSLKNPGILWLRKSGNPESDTFCKDLGISLNFSSGYHHSANQAERAVCTVKDFMKHCNSAGVHWCIALLEFLCTPGPDGHSPSELLGRQFHGILPMIDTYTVNSDKFVVI